MKEFKELKAFSCLIEYLDNGCYKSVEEPILASSEEDASRQANMFLNEFAAGQVLTTSVIDLSTK